MGWIRVTSGTDLAVRFVLLFLGVMAICAIAVVIEPAVKYVLEGTDFNSQNTAIIIAVSILVLWLISLPDDGDTYLDSISCFVYVLEVHKIVLSWADAKAFAGLFSTAYGTWYPLTEIAKLPRNHRRDALLAVAIRTGRLNSVPSYEQTMHGRRKTLLVVTGGTLAWLLFVLVGATRGGAGLDVSGFIQMGLVPVGTVWLTYLVLRVTKRRHSAT